MVKPPGQFLWVFPYERLSAIHHLFVIHLPIIRHPLSASRPLSAVLPLLVGLPLRKVVHCPLFIIRCLPFIHYPSAACGSNPIEGYPSSIVFRSSAFYLLVIHRLPSIRRLRVFPYKRLSIVCRPPTVCHPPSVFQLSVVCLLPTVYFSSAICLPSVVLLLAGLPLRKAICRPLFTFHLSAIPRPPSICHPFVACGSAPAKGCLSSIIRLLSTGCSLVVHHLPFVH